jgi:hypothetical protein
MPEAWAVQSSQGSFLFDLDGTLVDSVYQHVLAWDEALKAEGIELSIWRIHRKIGMSGGLLTHMLLRETELEISPERIERLQKLHVEAYRSRAQAVRPLPGARELLGYLTEAGTPWAVATSGRMESARPVLETLGVDFERRMLDQKSLREFIICAFGDFDRLVAIRLHLHINDTTLGGYNYDDTTSAFVTRWLRTKGEELKFPLVVM